MDEASRKDKQLGEASKIFFSPPPDYSREDECLKNLSLHINSASDVVFRLTKSDSPKKITFVIFLVIFMLFNSLRKCYG